MTSSAEESEGAVTFSAGESAEEAGGAEGVACEQVEAVSLLEAEACGEAAAS